MARVLTLTISPTIDISSHVEHVIPERKLRCDQPAIEPGGGGVNVARVLTRFGVDTLALITAGGMSGEQLINLLGEEGVAVKAVPIQGSTRENITIREDATTLQYRFCMPGPTIQPEEWAEIVREVERIEPAPAYLVVSGSQPPGLADDAIVEVLRIAKDRQIKVVLDTSGEPLRAALRESVFLVKPNLGELAQLEGDRWIEDDEHLRDAAQRLVRDHNTEAAVISLGAAGALAVSSEGLMRVPAPAVPPQSKVGAGDSMVAGIVWGLEQGKSVIEATVLGVAAGAATVMSPGAHLCNRADVERLYAYSREQLRLQVA